MRFVRIAAQDFLIFAASEIVMFLDRGMVGRLPLKRMSRRTVGKSADDKRDRPCRFVSLPLQAVRRGEGLAQMPRFDSGAIDRAALGNGIVFFYIGRVSDGQIGL